MYRHPDIVQTGFPMSSIGKLIGMPRPERPRTDFGKRMLEARQLAGLTQTAACKELGISQSTLAELERDANGSSHTVKAAKLYGCSAEWLATGDGSRFGGGLVGRVPGKKFDDRREVTPSDWASLQDLNDIRAHAGLSRKLDDLLAELKDLRAFADSVYSEKLKKGD